MAQEFDPYRKWLGIPPDEQPANHYRLLGIGLFESDPDVVSNAADRQMTHVRTFQSGKHSELSQRILNELSAARLCLLNDESRGQYDEQLRAKWAPVASAVAAPPLPPPPPPPMSQPTLPSSTLSNGVATPPPVAPTAGETSPKASSSADVPNLSRAPVRRGAGATPYTVGRKRASAQAPVVAGVVVGLVLAGILAVWLLSRPIPKAASSHSRSPGASADSTGGSSGGGAGVSPGEQSDGRRPGRPTVGDDDDSSTSKASIPEPGAPADPNHDPSSVDDPGTDPARTGPPPDAPDPTGEGEAPESPESPESPDGAGPETPTVEIAPPTEGSPENPTGDTTGDTTQKPLVGAETVEWGFQSLPDVERLESRQAPHKRVFLEQLGGTKESEAAVHRALKWLTNHQQPSGIWSFHHKVPRLRGEVLNPGTLETAPNAATALALLPLLAADHWPQGKYRADVFKGLAFLKQRLTPVAADSATLYETNAQTAPSHALGTIALCEAVAMHKDPSNAMAAQAAVNFIVQSQNGDGGWGVAPDLPNMRPDPSDMFSFGWNLAALRAARSAGLDVPDDTMIQAGKFLDAMRVSRRGRGGLADEVGYSSARSAGIDTEASVVGFGGRLFLGTARDDAELSSHVSLLAQAGPSLDGAFHFNYQANNVMRDYGGPTWRQWNPTLRDYLIQQQCQDGDEAGSWYASSGEPMNSLGGRLWCTALSALILESYYRSPPP